MFIQILFLIRLLVLFMLSYNCYLNILATNQYIHSLSIYKYHSYYLQIFSPIQVLDTLNIIDVSVYLLDPKTYTVTIW